jgi:hypothetical protein
METLPATLKGFIRQGFGTRFDLGLTYYPKRIFSLQPVLMSVLLNTVKMLKPYLYYKYEGINPNFSSTNAPENVYDQFNDAVPLDTVYNGYTTWRPK